MTRQSSAELGRLSITFTSITGTSALLVEVHRQVASLVGDLSPAGSRLVLLGVTDSAT